MSARSSIAGLVGDTTLLDVFEAGVADSALVLLHPDGRVATWSAAAERIEGYTADEILGYPLATFYLPDDVARGWPAEVLARARRAGRFTEEGWRVRRDGSQYRTRVVLTALSGDGGEVIGFARVVRDITEGHTTTTALRESEERFRTMANGAPVLLWMAGTDSLCTFFNQFWLEFTGRTQQQEYGNGWAEGIHAEDFQRCMDTYLSAFVARESFTMEYRMRRHDGEYRWIYDQGVPRFAPDGTFAGYIGSCIDITERRQAQQSLRRLNDELEQRIAERTRKLSTALDEREVLLREIHHRVKNNLQLISSLLNMQARQLDDPRSRGALEECKGRVQSIALIHEGLYQSEDLGSIPFAKYGRNLVTNVLHATGVSPGTVALEVELSDVALPVDRAIPCGLILNELITNSAKHAFPDGRRGTIRVELSEQPGDRLVLAVSDDGIGLPEDLDLERSSTLGLQLVLTLGEQLEAELHIERRGGACFRFTFQGRSVTEHAA